MALRTFEIGFYFGIPASLGVGTTMLVAYQLDAQDKLKQMFTFEWKNPFKGLFDWPSNPGQFHPVTQRKDVKDQATYEKWVKDYGTFSDYRNYKNKTPEQKEIEYNKFVNGQKPIEFTFDKMKFTIPPTPPPEPKPSDAWREGKGWKNNGFANYIPDR